MIKERKKYIILLSVLLTLALTCSVLTSGAETIAGNRDVGGVAYKLSDDGEYYTVVGYSESFPTLTIVSSIDGIPVTKIAESAFKNNFTVNKIEIRAQLTSIGDSAFRSCKNLTTINIPASLTELPFECFYDCTMLSNITLPSTLTYIGDFCFNNCTMLGKLSIPASVTEIGYDAFHGCESILLDVSENPYAQAYATENNINTDFKNTTAYFLLITAAGTLIAFAVVAAIGLIVRAHVKKHPTHDPRIYIKKFFAPIGAFFSFIKKQICRFYKFLLKQLKRLIALIERLIRNARIKAAKKREEKKALESEASSEDSEV